MIRLCNFGIVAIYLWFHTLCLLVNLNHHLECLSSSKFQYAAVKDDSECLCGGVRFVFNSFNFQDHIQPDTQFSSFSQKPSHWLTQTNVKPQLHTFESSYQCMRKYILQLLWTHTQTQVKLVSCSDRKLFRQPMYIVFYMYS